MTPMRMPALQAIHSEVNPAKRAAARAGTTCSGSVTESTWTMGAARTPSSPAISADSRVLARETLLGDRPASRAACSFSEAARVASPNRVHRYRAPRAIATAITSPVRMKRSTGAVTPRTVTAFEGRMLGACWGWVPNTSSTVA